MKHNVRQITWMVVALLIVGCAHTKPITVGIAADGGLTVAGRPCPESQLVSRLSELSSRHPQGVVIRADKTAPFTRVAAVMDACKTVGVQQVQSVPAQ